MPDKRFITLKHLTADWFAPLLLMMLLVAATSAPAQNNSLDFDNYWNNRTLSIDVQAGMAILTDTNYSPVDYAPGYGFSIEYYLPYIASIGFDFQQSQKDGNLTLPTKNYGDLDASGRLTLTSYSLQLKISSPVIDEFYNIYLELGVGGYIVNLSASTTLTVPYGGTDREFDYDLNYTIVEEGFNSGVGFDIVYWDTLKLGFLARLHYIMEQEKDTDFGAMGVFLKIGYTL